MTHPDIQRVWPPPGGYAWWYFDGVSDDGGWAFSAIFFVGSVFSPSYATHIRQGLRPPPEDYLGVNLALYKVDGRCVRPVTWVMSEYGEEKLDRSTDLAIAESRMEPLAGGGVRLHFRERTAPFFLVMWGVGEPMEGMVELEPLASPLELKHLVDQPGHGHRWWLRMPRARVKVRLKIPAIEFEGTGYHDVNAGDERLETAFSRWSWARFHGAQRNVVLYTVRPRDGAPRGWIVDGGALRPIESFAEDATRRIGWGLTMPRRVSADGFVADTTTVLDRSPFYARYLAELRQDDRPVASGLGEFLDLDRFSSRIIQLLLNYKFRHKYPPFLAR